MSIRDRQIMERIEGLLKEVKEEDAIQHRLMVGLLAEVFVEYNTEKNGSVEQKLYRMIDVEAQRGAREGSTK